MSFFDLLHTVGGRLRILEVSPKTRPGEIPKIATRTVTLEELKTHIRSEEVRQLADLPAELGVPFEKIFAAAGVAAATPSWDLARLKALLQTDPYKSQERGAAQKDLIAALDADHVQPEDLVKEAMAQDQALDQFEAFARKKADDQEARTRNQIAELEARIQSWQAERARLVERMRQDHEKLSAWRRNKRAYERELAAAIGYLTDRPVISTDEEA